MITSYQDFLNNNENEAQVGGTIMSLQEKKSAKGMPFAIIKFSDNNGEFELFLFSENLINNRDKLKEADSFILTLQKDRLVKDNTQRRVNIRKITSLDSIINKPYTNVTIELDDNFNIAELKDLLKKEGETEIKFIIHNKNNKIFYRLQNLRKFDYNQLKLIKTKEYVKKITV